MSQSFPTPSSHEENIKVIIDLSNYGTKKEINDITHADTSNFALKTNLANLKTEADKLDIDKLVPVPTDLSKLSNIVKNDVIKKTDFNSKITEIKGKILDISNLATKTALNTVENKIPDTSSLVKKNDHNTKITKIGGKIPDISNLTTKTALTAVENKMPSISNLVKKTV